MELGRLIGVGRTAEIYEYGIGTVIKLFFEGLDDSARLEYEKHLSVQIEDQPIPTLFNLEIVNNRLGIIFERIKGRTMKEYLEKSSDYMTIIRNLAELHMNLKKSHGLFELPRYSHELIGRIKRVGELTLKEAHKLENLIMQLDEEDYLIHGDFHPDNIMYSEEKAYIIDWNNASIGSIEADIANTIVTIEFGGRGSDINHDNLMKLIDLYKNIVIELGADEQKIHDWTPAVLAAKINESYDKNTKNDMLNRLRELI